MNASILVPPQVADELRALEARLTQCDIRRSRDALSNLLADDFREFGGSGRVFGKEAIIAALQAQPALEIEIEDFLAIWIETDSALVTYRGICRVVGSEKTLRSLRSSIWQKRKGHWQVLFHQGTPMPGSPSHVGGA